VTWEIESEALEDRIALVRARRASRTCSLLDAEADVTLLYAAAEATDKIAQVRARRALRACHLLADKRRGVTLRYAAAAVDAGLVEADDLRGHGRGKERRWYLA
jgi:hypothetical protein